MSSPKDNALKRNFLKIAIFNLEQRFKTRSKSHIEEIDVALKEIERIEESLKDIEFIDRENVLINMRAYKARLKVLKINEADLYNYIDYYYRHGNPQVAVFIDKSKKPKTPRKKKVTEE